MAKSLTLRVEPSASLRQAAENFLDEVRAWVERVIEANPDGVTSDSHDGGTFMVPWAVYAQASGDGRVAEFMRSYRDNAKAHFEAAGKWLDGYWRTQEAHHGPEHFQLFMHTLWSLDPTDAETVRQFEDAAEHIGNWKDGFPKWYDEERGMLRSFHLGTESVGKAAPNVPEHVRFVDMAVKAHEMTGAGRYLEFARAYGGRWAEAVLAGPELPVALDEDGAVYDLAADRERYRAFAGAAPKDLTQDLPRAENLLASGVPDVMLRLWQITGEDTFRAAAERITDAAAAALDSPIAWQCQAAVRRYRETTGSDRYDEQVAALAGVCGPQLEQLTIVPEVEGKPMGDPMGMRRDKPDWLDERGGLAPGPLLWALCGLVTDDEALLTRAVDLGAAHFRLGQRAFGDVTAHGCGSRSLSAVARGHGRLNGAGVVTEVLAPALA